MLVKENYPDKKCDKLNLYYNFVIKIFLRISHSAAIKILNEKKTINQKKASKVLILNHFRCYWNTFAR